MNRTDILTIMNAVMTKRGRQQLVAETQTTRSAGFRSLDFSETALRIEVVIGREMAFDAASMRQIETIRDVLDFFEDATRAD